MKHYKKLAYQLNGDEIRKVVSVTAPDGSSTVVGVLHRVDKTLVSDLPPGEYDLRRAQVVGGSVTLRVGPWQAQVDALSSVVVEVQEEALESVVLVGELEEGLVVGELEA